MLSFIAGTIGVAFLSVTTLLLLCGLFSEKYYTYGSQLENFIISKNPQNTADVERLTIEYQRKFDKGLL